MERRYLREIVCVTEQGGRRQNMLTPSVLGNIGFNYMLNDD